MSTNFKTFLIGIWGGLFWALLFMLVVQNIPHNTTVDNQQSYTTQSVRWNGNDGNQNNGDNNRNQEEMRNTLKEEMMDKSEQLLADIEAKKAGKVANDPEAKKPFGGDNSDPCDPNDEECILKKCENITEIPKIECEALVNLYFSTNGANWKSTLAGNSKWFSNNSPDSWYWVECWEGHVWIINLSNNLLNGTLPMSIWNLSQLTWMFMSNNQLRWELPSTIGNLTQLIQLKLGRNQLKWSIPSSIGKLTQLNDLHLYENQLHWPLPDSLGDLSELYDLDLYNNQITWPIPSSIGKLSQLKYLYLGNNKLAWPLPTSIWDLPNLAYLYLSHNQISWPIPSSLTKLEQIKMIDLYDNKLCGKVPNSFMNTWPNWIPFDYYFQKNKLLKTWYIPAMANWLKTTNFDFGDQQSEQCAPENEGPKSD